MIKSAIIITLAGAGAIGTGGTVLGPQAFQISAGSVVYEISKDGLEVERNDKAEFGVTFVTKGNRQITIRI